MIVRDALADKLAHRRRAAIVGQAPSRTSDPLRPLTGGRCGTLLREAMGLTLVSYVRIFERANLLDRWPGKAGSKGDRFPSREAREAAEAYAPLLAGKLVLALGRGVQGAFGSEAPFLEWAEDPRGFRIACLPHPSGVNLWWNDERNRDAARRFLRRLALGAGP